MQGRPPPLAPLRMQGSPPSLPPLRMQGRPPSLAPLRMQGRVGVGCMTTLRRPESRLYSAASTRPSGAHRIHWSTRRSPTGWSPTASALQPRSGQPGFREAFRNAPRFEAESYSRSAQKSDGGAYCTRPSTTIAGSVYGCSATRSPMMCSTSTPRALRSSEISARWHCWKIE